MFLIKGILPNGPYLPCVSMVGRAILAGYHRYMTLTFVFPIKSILNFHGQIIRLDRLININQNCDELLGCYWIVWDICLNKCWLILNQWVVVGILFLRWWHPFNLVDGSCDLPKCHHLGCLNNPSWNLGLCAVCCAHFMCHHELWPLSLSHTFSSHSRFRPCWRKTLPDLFFKILLFVIVFLLFCTILLFLLAFFWLGCFCNM